MIDALVEITQNAHSRLVMVAVAVVLLWIFVKAVRWILKACLILALIAVIAWKVPAVQSFLSSILN